MRLQASLYGERLFGCKISHIFSNAFAGAVASACEIGRSRTRSAVHDIAADDEKWQYQNVSED